MFVEEFVVRGDVATSESAHGSPLPVGDNQVNGDQTAMQMISAIVAQLSQSEVYCRAVNSLQQLTAEQGLDGQILLKAVSLEAIRLTLETVQAPRASVPPITETRPIDLSMTELAIDEAADDQLFAAIDNVIGNQPKSFPNPLAHPFKRYKAKRQIAVEEVKADTRAEILVKIGAQIQLEREQRGLSIAQLHAQTFIPMYHLQALEHGSIDQLPEDVYLRGFFSRIEKAFGLASGSLNDQLWNNHNVPASVLPCWGGHGAKGSHRGFGGLDINPTHLYMTYAAILASGIYWVSNQTAPQTNLPDLGVHRPRVEAASTQAQKANSAVTRSTKKANPQKSASSNSTSAKSVEVLSSRGIASPEVIR